MITFEALDVILRVQNLPGFMTRLRAGAGAVRTVGRAARSEAASTSAAIYAAAKRASLGMSMLAAAAGVAAFHQSVDFQKQFTLIQTQAGATRQEMEMFKPALLDMARTLPQGPIKLAQGLYHLRSVGLKGAQAMDALKVSAEGAAVGNANLEDTASALGAAWLAAIPGADGAAGSMQNLHSTMAILNATVGAGNMRMDELVTALGTGVLPTAKLAGLQLQDVMGALAVLKDEGYGAYGAMAQFATALHFFTDPTDKATGAMRRLGLSQMEVAQTMRDHGMVAALQLLRDHLDSTTSDLTKQEQLLGDILPGGRGRVFRVLLNQVDRYGQKINQINGTQRNFNDAIKQTHRTAAFQLHAAWSSLQVDLIQFGDKLRDNGVGAVKAFVGILRGLVRVLGFLADHINTVAAIIGPFIAAWLLYKTVLIAVTAAQIAWDAATSIGAFLSLAAGVRSFAEAWMLLDIAMEANPIVFIITAIIALGVAIYELWKHSETFRNIVTTGWHIISSVVVGVIKFIIKHWKLFILALGPIAIPILFVARHFKWFKNAVVNVFHAIKVVATVVAHFIAKHWEWMVSALFGPFAPFVHYIITHFHQIEHVASKVAHAIAHAFVWAFNKVKHAASDAKDWLLHYTPAGLLNRGADFLGLPHFAIGTYNAPGGWSVVGERGPEVVHLPPGSRVVPNHQLAGVGGHATTTSGSDSPPYQGGEGVVHEHHHIYLDGKEITEVVTHRIANKRARR